MRRRWIVLFAMSWLSVTPAFAELYRWTDGQGKVHITDSLDSIPPAYRHRARASSTDEPATEDPPAADGAAAEPRQPPAPAASPPPATPSSPAAPQKATAARLPELERDMTAARQERQRYLNELRNTQAVHVTPEFVRQRRQVGEMTQALLAVEQRLDNLTAEVARLQTQSQNQSATPAVQRARYTGLDAQGHDAAYWQQRVRAILPRLQQAQSRRRLLLTQLAASTAQRPGRELLLQVDALYQVDAELDATSQAWQALLQEAARAATPPEWLQ